MCVNPCSTDDDTRGRGTKVLALGMFSLGPGYHGPSCSSSPEQMRARAEGGRLPRCHPASSPMPSLTLPFPSWSLGLTPTGPRSSGQSSMWQGADRSFVCRQMPEIMKSK